MSIESVEIKSTIDRRNELVRELSKFNLPLRKDSKLCTSYINNQLNEEEWKLERIVYECCLMHWLFVFTDYPHRCNEAYRYFYTHFPHVQNIHTFINLNVRPYIKQSTIVDYGGVPQHWPWLKIPTTKTKI